MFSRYEVGAMLTTFYKAVAYGYHCRIANFVCLSTDENLGGAYEGKTIQPKLPMLRMETNSKLLRFAPPGARSAVTR